MACAPCAARRAANAAKQQFEYVWISANGDTEMVYPNENIAKAKVMRKGGSYTERPKGSG
jgi:hypothetical protein